MMDDPKRPQYDHDDKALVKDLRAAVKSLDVMESELKRSQGSEAIGTGGRRETAPSTYPWKPMRVPATNAPSAGPSTSEEKGC